MQIAPIKGGVTFVSHQRELHMFQLTEDEIDSLHAAGNYKAIDLALFTLCLGIFVAFVIALVTVESISINVFAAFIAISVVTFIGSIFFGVRAILASKIAQRKINNLKSGQRSD